MSGIFGPSSGPSAPRFDFSVLSDYYRAKVQLNSTSAPVARATESVSTKFAPWSQKSTLETATARLRDALSTTSFVDVRDEGINKAGVEADHKKLFAIYKGLSKLQALATRSADEKALEGERAALNRRFQGGLAEIKSFLIDKGFEDLTVLLGEKVSKVDSGFRKQRPPSLYSGPSVVNGASSNVISSLAGTEQFTVAVAKSGTTINVAMDLSAVSGELSVDNVIAYMNSQLEGAGVYTRFTRTTFNGKTTTDPKKYGIGVQTVATERVSFSAAATKPALYLGGVGGTGTTQVGQLVKLTDGGSEVASNFSNKITPQTGIADVRATATDSSGHVYVAGSVTGDLGEGEVQGDQDVYLRKYDGAGQLIWSRMLGSSQSATGFALATDSNGNVAIAGKVSDKLTSTSTGGGEDSFVTKFDSQGREIFTRQLSPSLDDQANALAFAADGSLFVAGQTQAAMSATVAHGGGSDAYLMKLTSSGSLEYVRQFGGSSDDRATAISIDSAGDVLLGSVEAGDAKVRKLSAANGTSAAIWEMSLGALGQGNLSSISVESGVVYAGGSTTNAALDAGGQASIVTAHGGASDGFVMKITDLGASAAAAFTAYVGTSGADSGLGLAVNGGSIYLAGSTNGSLVGGGAPARSAAFVRKLDSTGATVWTHQYESALGAAAARSIAVDGQGGSVLDKLGLPRGAIAFDETLSLTAGSSVRNGDYFYLKVNDGVKFKIKVDAGDTMRMLARKVSNVLLLKGSAEVSRAGGDGIKISAKEGQVIELIRGSDGFDALAGLGIDPVRLDNTKKSAATTTSASTFALGLKSDTAIGDKLKAGTVTYQLATAMEVIKSAFLSLTRTPKTGAPNARALQSYKSL